MVDDDKPETPRRGPLWIPLAAAVMLGGMFWVAQADLMKDGSSDWRQQVQEPPASCDAGAAEAHIIAAQALGVTTGLDVTPREGVVVTVAARPWRRMGLEQQKAMAAAFDCRLTQGRGHVSEMHFRIDRSGSDLYGLTRDELYALRRDGYSPSPGD